MSRKAKWCAAAFAAALLALVLLGMVSGSLRMSIGDVARTLVGAETNPAYAMTLYDYRLPRIVLAVLVGLGLALTGAAMQSIAKNGLADPSILGINAGAGTGVVAFVFAMQGAVSSEHWFSVFLRPLFGWVGGMLAAGIIFLLSWQRGKLDMTRFVLIGIAVAAGFSAVTLLLSLKMDADDYHKVDNWLHGSLYNASWVSILAVLPWQLFLLPILWRKRGELDFFQLDEASVKSLGVRLNREKMILLLASVGIVSACVSVAGNVAFVGLIAPHVARQLVGVRHANLLPVSGLAGIVLVLLSDYLARIVLPAEMPVGLITAIVGVPYLLCLMFKRKV